MPCLKINALEFETIGELLDARGASIPATPALICGEGTLSYGRFAELARRAAGLLQMSGVLAGDRVGIAVGNGLDFPVALFAAAHLGAIIVPLHMQHRGSVLHHMVGHADLSMIIADTSVLDDGQQTVLADAAPRAEHIEAVAGQSDFMARAERSEPFESDGVAGPLSILFTSGTTGRSKGVVLDHAYYLCTAQTYCEVVDVQASDRLGTVLPLVHANAQCDTLLGGVLAGVPVICRRGFSARAFWRDLAADGATVVNLLGAMAPILLKTHPERVSEHGVRLAVGGAIPASTALEFRERFGVDTREIFGLTESGLVSGEAGDARRLGSVGRPRSFWDVRVAEPDNEIQIRERVPGATFREYWRDPERTAEAFTDDGWLRSGDLGRFDEDGFLYFSGRLKDCIRRRGENISADELEMIVNRHPRVAECVALAVPSEFVEDEVKLAYVVVPGETLDPMELHQFCRAEMATFMVPRYLEQRESLPRTPSLKVMKHELTSTSPPVIDMVGSPDPRARQTL